jgi:signal transduction histidine kinase
VGEDGRVRELELGTTGAGAARSLTDEAIHELVRSRAMLAESQKLARLGSWTWDLVTDRVWFSDELHRIFGLELGNFGGTYAHFLEQVHPLDLDLTRGVVARAQEQAGRFEYDHRIVRADGTVRMLHTQGESVADEHGRVVRMRGSCWDITQQWAATSSLERSVSLLEATLEATADGLLVVDRRGKMVAMNQRFLQLWRISPELAARGDDSEVLQVATDQLDDPEGFLLRVRELYAAPEREAFDVLRFRDGRVYERYSRPQRLGNEVVGRVWSFRDVTDRERLLHRALFLADASRLLGSLEAEKALHSVAQLAVPYLADACAVDLIAHGDGAPRRLTVSDRGHLDLPELPASVQAGQPALYRADGSHYLTVPLQAHGRLHGWLTLASRRRPYDDADLSLIEELARRASLSLENARLYRDAQEALRIREEFLSIAAHEIRGPLTSIHLSVQSLKEVHPLTSEQRTRALDIVEREDRRLGRLVDDLLDVSRIRAGRLQFVLEPVDLVAVTREVAARLGPDLARTGSGLTVTGSQVVGRWDRERLDQVVTNLLSNAIKFGCGHPIAVRIGTRDGHARLEVEDLGVGIPAEALARIFEPFERASSARHYGGLGLGLYIVKMIVEGLNGTVRVVSTPGKGTLFAVELPLG